MKKFLALSLAAVALLIALPQSMALQVTSMGNPGGYGPYQTGSGGEFTLKTDLALSWVLNAGYVSGVTKDIWQTGTFQTFCVEHGEYIYPNTTFDVTISDKSIYTNVQLTQGAAWLYHQFQIGQLAGYDYTRANTAIVQDLQNAIWYFMGQGADPGNQFSVLGSANGGFALNNGLIPVAVLNLWVPGHVNGGATYARQDMLVCVPDGGLTVTLLGMALGSLALVSRKICKS